MGRPKGHCLQKGSTFSIRRRTHPTAPKNNPAKPNPQAKIEANKSPLFPPPGTHKEAFLQNKQKHPFILPEKMV